MSSPLECEARRCRHRVAVTSILALILISSTGWADERQAEPESSEVAVDVSREGTPPEIGEPPPGEGWRDGRGQARLRERWRALSPEERRAFRRRFEERRLERRAFREFPGPERRALRRHLREIGPEERRRFRQLSLEEKGAVVERLRELRALDDGERLRLRERYREFRALPPDQRERLRENSRRLRDMPPKQRERLREQMKRLRLMPPEERSELLDELLDEEESGP
jgi:hypothetical protein